ncbi:MAG: LptF/LptG family permease [Verrucomicrobia bacterium]|nr:LptF/LptG family permease [Verrucomicrobiota bacterium]
MPILWRYLLKQYLKVFALCVITFIALLFVSRAKEIADLAAMGAGASHIALFALFLIPYVLPYALPISCLISSVLLFSRLSFTHELTAMRACGLSLRRILGPVLLTGGALALLNFYVASELATHSHMLGRKMETQVAGLNPLHLLQNSRLLRMGDVYVEMHTVKGGECAKEMMAVAYNDNTKRLTLLLADTLEVQEEGTILAGEKVHLMIPLPSEHEGFDHLIIENQGKISTSANSLGQLLGKRRLHLKPSHLQMRLLLARLKGEKGIERARDLSEIGRRVAMGLFVLTFTLLGCAFGLQTGRSPKKRNIAMTILLATLLIGCYSAAGGFDAHLPLSLLLNLLPQFLVIVLCLTLLKRITKGATS